MGEERKVGENFDSNEADSIFDKLRNVEGKIGPKFQNDLTEMLGLHVFATFRLQRTCRKIESFFH